MTGHPQAMSAERIEKAARAIAVLDGLNWDAPPSSNIDINRPLYRQRAEAALRAAYPELADGSSVILPWHPDERMQFAATHVCQPNLDPLETYVAMRDAHLSRGSNE